LAPYVFVGIYFCVGITHLMVGLRSRLRDCERMIFVAMNPLA
jgi:hypothetical protein